MLKKSLSDFVNYISKVGDHADIRIREYHFNNGYGIILFINPKEFRTQLIIRKNNSWECVCRNSDNYTTKLESEVVKTLDAVNKLNQDLINE